MVQRRSFLFYAVFFYFACAPAFAQDGLQLSGVMQGERPTAIVNDTIVAVGDSVGNYRVSEIAVDHVIFEGKSGKVTKYLKEPEPETKTKNVKPAAVKPKAADKKPAIPATPAQAPQSNDKARKRLDGSIAYLKQADELLSGGFKFERLYAKAIDLCGEAEREAQAALTGLTDPTVRGQVNGHIARIRKAKEAISRERADFNTRVRSTIAAKKLFTGMTTQDALSSWGVPLMKSSGGTAERWVYQDGNGYQTELTFDQGILISF